MGEREGGREGEREREERGREGEERGRERGREREQKMKGGIGKCDDDPTGHRIFSFSNILQWLRVCNNSTNHDFIEVMLSSSPLETTPHQHFTCQ